MTTGTLFDKLVACKQCGRYIKRKKYASGRWEWLTKHNARTYCGPPRRCKAKALRVGGHAYNLRMERRSPPPCGGEP